MVIFIKNIFCQLLVFLPVISLAQATDSIFNLVDSIPIEAKYITSDRIANLYVVSPSNEVIKYNSRGQEQFRFNNNTLGILRLVDATDPFNLLLYYPDFQTAITLDRTMNETNRFDFLSLGVPSVSAVALSNDNLVWYYDELDFKLKKIDANGGIVSQSEDLTLLIGEALSVTQIKALGNWVYLNAPELGLLVFDQFGQYHQLIEQDQIKDFQLIGEHLILAKEERFLQYHWPIKQAVELPIPEEDFLQISWQQNYLFLLNGEGVLIYAY